MEEKKESKKTRDPITEFTYEAVDTRYKEVVINTLLETKKALDDKSKECDENSEALQKVKQDNTTLRQALETQKRQYEEKLAEVKTQIGQGLNNEGDPVQRIKDGIKIIDDKNMDFLILPSDSGRGDKPRPKLDSNTPSFSGKDGERLDEWLFVMNTAFESLNVRDGKERLNMATVYVKEGPLKA